MPHDMQKLVTQALRDAGRPGENKLRRLATMDKYARWRRDDRHWDARVLQQQIDDQETMRRWFGRNA